jgi:hypothetical protein
VRVVDGSPVTATVDLGGTLTVDAASPGVWGNNLNASVDHNTIDSATRFNLVIREVVNSQVINSEVYRNLSMDKNDSRYAVRVVNDASSLVRLEDPNTTTPGPLPADDGPDVISSAPAGHQLQNGTDGVVPGAATWTGAALIAGLSALDRIAPYIFNILCIPAAANLSTDVQMNAVFTAATHTCLDHRAFFIVDIPATVQTVSGMTTWLGNATSPHTNAAVYFPRLEIADPLNENRLRNVGPSGTLAGVYARTDATRGVWKAPAGTEADLRGARVAVKLTDADNGALNPFGINALRNFPVFGNISWGARTLKGADMQASEWKYIPVRRTALYIEESLYQGSKWIVFEPNDEPLWAQIRLNFGAFMHNLFRQGAFQGTTPKDAYFVQCDKTTTTQNDIDRGVVNILVGFAPLKPAEFVVIKLQQMAGQIEV